MKMIIHHQQFHLLKRNPIGDVVTNSLKNSITREATDKLLQDFGTALKLLILILQLVLQQLHLTESMV